MTKMTFKFNVDMGRVWKGDLRKEIGVNTTHSFVQMIQAIKKVDAAFKEEYDPYHHRKYVTIGLANKIIRHVFADIEEIEIKYQKSSD